MSAANFTSVIRTVFNRRRRRRSDMDHTRRFATTMTASDSTANFRALNRPIFTFEINFARQFLRGAFKNVPLYLCDNFGKYICWFLKYYLRRRLASGEGITNAVCVCVRRAATARRISLRGEDNALYPMLSSFYRAMHVVHSAVLLSRVVRPSVRPSVRLSFRP